MNLAETLLPKLADWKPSGEGRHSLSAAAPGWAVTVAADRVDALSCLVWEAAFDRTAPAGDGLTLAGWAGRIAAAPSGLGDELKVIEIDAHAREALLRSATPAKRGDKVLYYEVRLHGLGRAVVRRFQADAGREQVAFPLTHEGLVTLAEAVTA
jgi:hypothetical protein